MTNLAIYGSRRQRDSFPHIAQLLAALTAASPDIRVAFDGKFARALQQAGIPLPPQSEIFEGRPEHPVQLVLSVGGDGTFLSTVEKLGDCPTPVMGINSGHLGYLSAAEISQVPEIVDAIVRRNYFTQSRSMLDVTVIDTEGHAIYHRIGLNEVALLRRDTASMISVSAMLQGRPLACYHADGLIVSTPTGSTAYNLSAGGPIAAPDTGIRIITPVAPHSLNMRPLVVADSSHITLTVESRSDTVLLSVDGKATPIAATHRIEVAKAPHLLHLALLEGHNFIDTLRQKLLWGYDNI